MMQSMDSWESGGYDLEFEIIRDHMHIDCVFDVILNILKIYLPKYLSKLKTETVDNYLKYLIIAQTHETEKYKRFFEQYVKGDTVLDPHQFRRNLEKYCPIFHGAVNSTTQLLNPWKKEFYHCDCSLLYKTIYYISEFSRKYNQLFTEDKMKGIKFWEDNRLIELDNTDGRCYMTGVIGYGVMSTIAYNLYPRLFPGNYKQGVFSLYFLSGREPIDMPSKTSEFLMVKDMQRSSTGIIESDHNYFFPYEVYAYYSLKIYNVVKNCIYKYLNFRFPDEHRYVLTQDFYSFVVRCNFKKMQTLLGNDDYLKFETWSLF